VGSSVSVFICDLGVRWLCDACVWLFLVGIASYFRVSLCVRFRVSRPLGNRAQPLSMRDQPLSMRDQPLSMRDQPLSMRD
jgi:hypothetical protein